jgi:hypothetical protein
VSSSLDALLANLEENPTDVPLRRALADCLLETDPDGDLTFAVNWLVGRGSGPRSTTRTITGTLMVIQAWSPRRQTTPTT